MMTSSMYGNPLAPASLCDDKGNAVTVQHTTTAMWLEKLLRPASTLFALIPQ